MQYRSLKVVLKELWKSKCCIFPYRANPFEGTEFEDF